MYYINLISSVFDHVEVAETKIDAVAARNAPGVLHGVKDALGVRFLTRNRRVSGFTMPML